MPFIELTKEINDLIAGCIKQISTLVQIMKETGARRGEIFSLNWSNIYFVSKTVRIAPEKGSNPRIFKMSEKLITMLHNLPNLQKEFGPIRMLTIWKNAIVDNEKELLPN